MRARSLSGRSARTQTHTDTHAEDAHTHTQPLVSTWVATVSLSLSAQGRKRGRESGAWRQVALGVYSGEATVHKASVLAHSLCARLRQAASSPPDPDHPHKDLQSWLPKALQVSFSLSSARALSLSAAHFRETVRVRVCEDLDAHVVS
eukprot:3037473-Rhodomonas_salina.1